MSAVELISEIRKLPEPQRRQVFQFVAEEIRREEDRIDNEAAERALKEPAENIRGPKHAKGLAGHEWLPAGNSAVG